MRGFAEKMQIHALFFYGDRCMKNLIKRNAWGCVYKKGVEGFGNAIFCSPKKPKKV